MPAVERLADFLHHLQQLEKISAVSQPGLILDAFTSHTAFPAGAIYLRDESGLHLAAASKACVAPEILDYETPSDVITAPDFDIDPRPHLVVPLRTHRDSLGVVLLAKQTADPTTDDDITVARLAAAFMNNLMANQRLLQEAREGDFQLKYRLWELESLYEIGLSIASTLNIEELADEILFRMISLTNARRAALFLREGSHFKIYREFGDVRSEFFDQELAVQLSLQRNAVTFDEGTDCIFPGCKAFVAVPIRGNDEVIGILAAADRETRDGGIGAFEDNELRLLSSFASQVAIALENARLHREALAKLAMERELELAATIQRDILPRGIPHVHDVAIATLARPAKQVGGDYHAFFERDGILTLLVADVAGKSIPAAMLVSAFHAAVQLLFAEGRSIADIATELNEHIHRWSAENKFITMVIVSIDREAEMLEYVNAGHNPAYLLADGRMETLKSHGLPIGILARTRYAAQRRHFPRGAAVVLYSDGITEAENLAGEEFDNPRLEEVLEANADASPDDLRDAIVSNVDAFVGEAPQKDDQTIVIARFIAEE